jgi:hypothetical protein
MKRRSVCGTVFGLLVAPVPGRAQQAVRRIGLTVPQALLMRADEVLQ